MTTEWFINIAHEILGITYAVIMASWHMLKDASVYLLFGFLIAGLIRLLLPDDKVVKYLGGKGTKPILIASLFGIPLPLCSCGVIPAAIGLRKQGAGKSATMSFLVSTPETGVDSMAITYALLDPLMTIFRPIAAFLTAMVTGILDDYFNRDISDTNDYIHIHDDTCNEDCTEKTIYETYQNSSLISRLGMAIRYGFVDLLGDLAKWLILGILIAGLISYLIPVGFIQNYLNNEWVAMLVMFVAGIPLYVCATASTPIAAALMVKGLSPGAALVFLLAGPASNVATITVVAKYFGKRSLAVYLGSIIICSIMFGFILNHIYYGFGINPIAIVGKAGELVPDSWSTIGAWVLIILTPYAWYNDFRNRKKTHADNIPQIAQGHSHM